MADSIERGGGNAVMKMKKWVIQETDSGLRDKLVKELGISPILANLLLNRGLRDPQEITEFLNRRCSSFLTF